MKVGWRGEGWETDTLRFLEVFVVVVVVAVAKRAFPSLTASSITLCSTSALLKAVTQYTTYTHTKAYTHTHIYIPEQPYLMRIVFVFWFSEFLTSHAF